MQGAPVVVGQDLPGLDVRDGSLHDVTDPAQGFARLSLGLGELAVGRFLVGGENPGYDVAFIGDSAGGVDLLEHAGSGDGPGVVGGPGQGVRGPPQVPGEADQHLQAHTGAPVPARPQVEPVLPAPARQEGPIDDVHVGAEDLLKGPKALAMIRVTTEIVREVAGWDTPMISAIPAWEALVRRYIKVARTAASGLRTRGARAISLSPSTSSTNLLICTLSRPVTPLTMTARSLRGSMLQLDSLRSTSTVT